MKTSCVVGVVLVLLVGGSGYASADLQTVFDDICVSGPGIDAANDRSDYELFASTPTAGSVATLVVDGTVSGNVDSFGIYSVDDPTNRAQFFAGTAATGNQVIVSFMANGDVMVNFMPVANGFAENFGFYLSTTGGETYFTQDSLNAGGQRRAWAYQGDDATVMEIDPLPPGVFGSSEFVIAFESGSDANYCDFVVLAESLVGVPEPASLALLAAGGLLMRRRRR